MFYTTKFDGKKPLGYRISPSTFYTDLNVIEVGHGKVEPDHNAIYLRNKYILHYVVDGKGIFCNQPFKKNYCYFVQQGDLERILADHLHPYETYWIMFKGTSARDILDKCNIPQHNSAFKFEKASMCAKIISKALYDINPSNSVEESFYLQAAFNSVMSIHFSEINLETTDHSVANQVRDYLKNNYTDKISIADIATKFNFSRSYIYTLFKNNYGISPQDYLVNLRINNAKEILLNEKNLSIRDIAFAVGYDDALYFSKLFHKKVGVSPKEFKKQNAISAPKTI